MSKKNYCPVGKIFCARYIKDTNQCKSSDHWQTINNVLGLYGMKQCPWPDRQLYESKIGQLRPYIVDELLKLKFSGIPKVKLIDQVANIAIKAWERL